MMNWKARRDKSLAARPSSFTILGSNSKIVKGEKVGYLTAGISLSPSRESVPYGGVNACPFSSKGCEEACLKFAGLNRMPHARVRRIELFLWYINDKKTFLERLDIEIEAFIKRAKKKDMVPAIRPNVLQDLRGLGRYIANKFGNEVKVYDYTKIPLNAEPEPNYALTFSRSESNEEEAIRALNLGYQVAVVFDTQGSLPDTWKGFPVVSGDETDLRFLETDRSIVVGLTLKGTNAAKDAARKSGFAVAC